MTGAILIGVTAVTEGLNSAETEGDFKLWNVRL